MCIYDVGLVLRLLTGNNVIIIIIIVFFISLTVIFHLELDGE